MNIQNESTEPTESTEPEVTVTEAPTPTATETAETTDASAPIDAEVVKVVTTPKAKSTSTAVALKAIDPEVLTREKKIFQARLDFFIIDEVHNRTKQQKLVDEYARTIPEVGVEKALLVKIITDENGVRRGLVFDGMHRILACQQVVANGGDPGWIPYTVDNSLNEEKRDIIQLRRNTGAPMLPYDEAMCFDRLIKKGWTRDEIAKESGKTTSHIAQILPLCSAPKEVHRYLIDERISATLLLTMLKANNGNWEILTPILRTLIAAKEASNATGKKAEKITDADVQKSGVEAVKKVTMVHKRFDRVIAEFKAVECETESDKALMKTKVKITEVLQKGLDMMDEDPQKGLAFIMKRVGLK